MKNNFTFLKTAKYILVVFVMFISSSVMGQTNTFSAAVNSNWNNAGNWSLAVTPTVDHDVIIGNGRNAIISSDANALCKTLTLGNASGFGKITFTPVLGAQTNLIVIGTIMLGHSATPATNYGQITMHSATLVSCIKIQKRAAAQCQVTNLSDTGIFEFTSTTPPVAGNIPAGMAGTWSTALTFPPFNDVRINMALSSHTTNAPAGFRVANNLSIVKGKLNLAGNYVKKTTPKGTLTIASEARLRIGGSSATNADQPDDFLDYNLTKYSEVEYYGSHAAFQNIIPATYSLLYITANPKKLTTDVSVSDGLEFIGSTSRLRLNDKTLTLRNYINDENSGSIYGSNLSNIIFSGLDAMGGAPITIYFDQAVPGSSNSLKNLTIITETDKPEIPDNDFNVALGNNLDLYEVLALGNETPLSYGKLDTAGFLTFKSNATSTAILAPISDLTNSSITGDVVVERYIPARRAYRLLSPSVTGGSVFDNWQEGGLIDPAFGTHITGIVGTVNNGTPDLTTGLDFTASGNPSMYRYNNTSSPIGWAAVTNTVSETLNAGYPYLINVRGDRTVDLASNATSPTNTTLRMTGALTTGDVTLAEAGFLQSGPDAWSLVGNPYQSPVDMNKILLDDAVNSENLVQAYLAWDTNAGLKGAYVAWDVLLNTNSVLGSDVNQFVQPNQAFFVRRIGNNSGTAFLKFSEASKEVNTTVTNIYRQQSSNSIPLLKATLFDPTALSQGKSGYDGFVIGFSDAFVNEVNDTDITKYNGNSDEVFGRQNGTSLLSIERRKMPLHEEILPLKNIYNFSTSDATDTAVKNYVIKLNIDNLSGMDTYLRDNYNNTETLLSSASNLYPYSITQSIAASVSQSRFSIVFRDPALTVKTNFTNDGFVVYPNPVVNNTFTIKANEIIVNEISEVVLFNLLGQEIYRSQLSTNNFNNGEVVISPNKELSKGVYLLNLISNKKVLTKKLTVE